MQRGKKTTEEQWAITVTVLRKESVTGTVAHHNNNHVIGSVEKRMDAAATALAEQHTGCYYGLRLPSDKYLNSSTNLAT